MVVVQKRSKRKPSGARYHSKPTKRVNQIGRKPTGTRIGKVTAKTNRTKGGGSKSRLLLAKKVNIYDSASKKYVVAEIKNVEDSSANTHFIRRNILTKGAIIETSKGKAKVTSRPGQEGSVNAVLIK